MPLRCTWDQVAAFRLRRQHLAEPGDDPVAVADRLVGVHAQIASSAEMSLAARVPGLTAADVRGAVAMRRSLVKAWGLRKTLHLFAPAQLAVVLAALRTRSRYRDAHLRPAWLRYHKVTLEEMQAIDAHVGEALDGRALTRDELASELERITGSDSVGDAVGLGRRAQARIVPRRALLRPPTAGATSPSSAPTSRSGPDPSRPPRPRSFCAGACAPTGRWRWTTCGAGWAFSRPTRGACSSGSATRWSRSTSRAGRA